MYLRFIFVFIAAAMTFFATFAEEGSNYLHIRTNSGWQVLSLDQVDRLTFKNNVMTATDANNNVVASFPQDQLEAMRVNESAGVNDVTADTNADATFTFDAADATATMLADGDFEVYSLNGSLLVRIPEVKKGETINLSAVESGIVIVKSGNYSAKVTIK